MIRSLGITAASSLSTLRKLARSSSENPRFTLFFTCFLLRSSYDDFSLDFIRGGTEARRFLFGLQLPSFKGSNFSFSSNPTSVDEVASSPELKKRPPRPTRKPPALNSLVDEVASSPELKKRPSRPSRKPPAALVDKVVNVSSTFSGNYLASATGLASVEVILNEVLVERSAKMGSKLRASSLWIQKKYIKEVRRRGLFNAVEHSRALSLLSGRTTFSSIRLEGTHSLHICSDNIRLAAAQINNPSGVIKRKISGELKRPIYLDEASTTRIDFRVLVVMNPYLTERYGNSSASTHFFGWVAEVAIESARTLVASLLHCSSKEVLFMSGATEANNTAIKRAFGFFKESKRHIITSATEHSSVLDSCRYMEERVIEVTYLSVRFNGMIDLDELRAAFDRILD